MTRSGNSRLPVRRPLARALAGIGFAGAARAAGTWVRSRFPAARNGGKVDFGTAASVMGFLCQTLPRRDLADFKPKANRGMVSLADPALPFGTRAAQPPRFLESDRPARHGCIWEAF